MSGVNKVILLGRLGKDPDVKTTSGGKTLATLNLATSSKYNDVEYTEWHRVVIWGKLAELCGRYTAKGNQVYVEGRLQSRSYEDKNGAKQYVTEVVASNVTFLGSKEPTDNYTPSHDSFGPEPTFDQSEEIPF